MRNLFNTFRKSESGATLVEYGVALILAIIIGGGALVTLAGTTEGNLNEAGNRMDCWSDDSCDTGGGAGGDTGGDTGG